MTKPVTHFRQLQTTTDLTAIETPTLDNIACQLMREIDNLETYGTDVNGEWLGKTDKRSHAKWSSYLHAVCDVLDNRGIEAN